MPGTTYNGTPAPVEGVLLPSAARTANTTVPNQTNENARGVLLILNITGGQATGGLQPVIQYVDPISGSTPAPAAPAAAVLAAGKYGYVLYPGIGAAANDVKQAINAVLPRTWNVVIIHGDGSSYTYSLSYCLLP